MKKTNKSFIYKFVIETEEYAGNFEREMCAYMTGRVGECSVGKKESTIFYKEIENNIIGDDDIAIIPDEHGCSRPVELYPINNSYHTAINFYNKPTKKQIDFLKARAFKFQEYTKHSKDILNGEKNIGIKSFYIATETLSYEEERV